MPKYNVYMGKETGYSDVIHLIKGDKRTAIIRMAIKRRNNGVDLEGLAWKINVVNAAGQEDVYTPSAVVKDDNGIFVEWMPKGIATAAEGYTRYQLVGLGNDATGEQMECWFAEKRISVGPSFDAQISDEQEEAASALDEMIMTVQLELPTVYAARDAANAAAKAANDSAAGADASAAKANTAAATANAAAEKANTAASKANTAASGANTAANSATAAAGIANTAASTANKAAASVNEAKDSAIAAAATANSAANSANAAAQRTETAVSNAASAASNANSAADRASAATTNANSAAANASNSSDKADASATKAESASSEAVTATQNAKDAASIATAAAMNANAAANRANEAADNVKDGVSPAASVEKIDDKVIFSVTDASGTTSVSMPSNEKVLEVANAASEKADEANAKFDGLTSEYELIGSVTLTEAVNEVLFDGFGILKEFYLDVTMEAGESDVLGYVQARVSKGTNGVGLSISNYRRTSKRYTRASYKERPNGIAEFFAVTPSTEAKIGSTCAGMGFFINPNDVGCVRTYLTSGNLFPAGSKFDLWGVRA